MQTVQMQNNYAYWLWNKPGVSIPLGKAGHPCSVSIYGMNHCLQPIETQKSDLK